MTPASASQFHVHLPWVNGRFAKHSVLIVGAFSVTVKLREGWLRALPDSECRDDAPVSHHTFVTAAIAQQPAARSRDRELKRLNNLSLLWSPY